MTYSVAPPLPTVPRGWPASTRYPAHPPLQRLRQPQRLLLFLFLFLFLLLRLPQRLWRLWLRPPLPQRRRRSATKT